MRTSAERLAAWNEVAPGWERRREAVWRASKHVSARLTADAGVRAGQTVLEIAAGTGETALLLAEVVGASGRVIATDFSPAMVDVIRRTADGRDNVQARVLDAQAMDLPDDHVDAVVCRFGFNLMPDPAAALTESRRVLRAGGALSLAVWGSAAANPWITAITSSLADAGGVPTGDGVGGMFSLADHATLDSLLHGAAFDEVEVGDLDHPWRYESFAELWETQTDLSGALSAVLPTLSQQVADRVRSAVEDRLAPYRTGSSYDIPGSVVCAVAR